MNLITIIKIKDPRYKKKIFSKIYLICFKLINYFIIFKIKFKKKKNYFRMAEILNSNTHIFKGSLIEKGNKKKKIEKKYNN
jgi:hypothetical protein